VKSNELNDKVKVGDQTFMVCGASLLDVLPCCSAEQLGLQGVACLAASSKQLRTISLKLLPKDGSMLLPALEAAAKQALQLHQQQLQKQQQQQQQQREKEKEQGQSNQPMQALARLRLSCSSTYRQSTGFCSKRLQQQLLQVWLNEHCRFLQCRSSVQSSC
jgi:hypothetical protein